MDKLKYSDLFDFNDQTEVEKCVKAIDLLENEYGHLSKVLVEEAGRIKAALSGVTDILKENEKVLKTLNVTTGEQQKKALQVAAEVEKQVTAYTDLEKAQKGITATQKLYDDSLGGLKSKLKDLTKELDTVSRSAEPDKFRQLATAITETKAQADSMKLAARGLTHQFEAATGSYKALQIENGKLSAELRGLAGGMDGTSARAKELKEQIFANTQKLKDFDKEINQSYRNVGNYAESIIAAKEQLDRNRSSLLSQIAALKQQAAANVQNVELQNKIQAELQQTNAQLYSVNQQLGSFKSNSDLATDTANKFADRIKRIGIETVGVYIGFEALKNGLGAIVTMNSEISDSQADVMKTTGLTKQAVNDLTDAFEELDTRTAIKDLLAISTIGGQLGTSASDIDEFTAAIDKAVVALGDEFGGGAEEVATALAKINNVYGTSKDIGLEAGLTNIGSAINEIGASGASTSPFLTDFALRVGAVSANAGLGLDKVLGYGAALEELGFTSEVAGSAFQKLVGKMAANSKQFFDIAKMGDANLSLKEFEKLINTDVDQALKVFLKGLNAGGSSTTAFSAIIKDLKLDGAGASASLTALAKNTELVAERQRVAGEQLKDGTSLAAEFAVKNDNLAASIEKLKKGFTNLFVSGEIQGAMKSFVDTILFIGGALKTLFKGLNDNKDIIAASIPVLVGFRTATYAATVSQKGWLVSLGLTRMALLRNIVTMRAWYATVMANPIGLIIAAIVALVVGFNRLEKTQQRNMELAKMTNALHNKTEKAIKQVEEAQKGINEQIAKYNTLSPKEQEQLKEKIKNEKALALAILDRLEVERQALVRKAAEISMFDKIKAGVLSAGNAVAYISTLVEQQGDRMAAANRKGVEEITRLRNAIKGYDEELISIGAAAAEQAEADAATKKKNTKAEMELQRFRLEQQAKALELFAAEQEKENAKWAKYFEEGVINAQQFEDKVKGTTGNIQNAQREASYLRIRMAGLERDMLLANEDLIGAERTKIIEEYAAKSREIQRALAKELDIEELMPRNSTNTWLEKREKEEKEAQQRTKQRMDKHLKELEAAWDKSEEERTKKLKEEEEKRAAIKKAGEDLAWAAYDAAFEIGAMRNEAEIERLEMQKQQELTIAGDNEEAKARIEEEYTKRQNALRNKQAKADRLRALFEIALNTGVAISKAVADSPLTFGLPWSGFALANGAIQAALVLSKPLPQYYKGREGGPAEYAVVDEKGPEIIERKGELYLGQSGGPRVTHLGAGDKVYTAYETERMLQDILSGDDGQKFMGTMQRTNTHLNAALKPQNEATAQRQLLQGMGGYFKQLEKVIKGKQEVKINITKQGIETLVKTGETWNKYANDRYNSI